MRSRYVCTFCFIFIVVFSGLCQCTSYSQSLEKFWIDQGNSQLSKGIKDGSGEQCERAAKSYLLAINTNSSHSDLWAVAGSAFLCAKNYNKSLDCFNHVNIANSNLSYIFYGNKALALLALKNLNDSNLYIDKALEIKPTSSFYWGIKSIILMEKGQLNESLAVCNRSLEINSSFAPFWVVKGTILLGLRRYNDSLECCNESTRLDPSFAQGWLLKGIVLSNFNKLNESYLCCDKATKLDPLSAPAWAYKGLVLVSMKEYNKASECINKSVDLNPSFKNLKSEVAMLQRLTIKSTEVVTSEEVVTVCEHVCNISCIEVCEETGINCCDVTGLCENTLVSCIRTWTLVNELYCETISTKITLFIVDGIIDETIIEITVITIHEILSVISWSESWSYII